MSAIAAPDAACLLAMLGGTDRIVIDYDITTQDELEDIGGVLTSAMEAWDVRAELPIVAEAVVMVRDAVKARTRRLPRLVPESDIARYEAMPVVELAAYLDPFGDYTMMRLCRMAA